MANQDWFDKDFYKALGVSPEASDNEIKKSYRKLAKDLDYRADEQTIRSKMREFLAQSKAQLMSDSGS